VVSPDGSTVFVTGSSAGNAVQHGADDDFQLATVAYDAATGHPLWAARYSGPLGGGTLAAADAIALSPNGATVYVTGQDQQAGGGPSAYVTVAYDAATGTQLWAQTFQTPLPAGPGPDKATAIAVSPDGSAVFVTGKDQVSADGGYSYGTVAYDAATGAQLWTATAYSEAAASGIAVSPDSQTVYVTGSVAPAGPDGSYEYGTVAYRAATGAQLWSELYQAQPGAAGSYATAIAVSPDGSAVFVTGGTSSASTDAYATVSYAAATGATRWSRLYQHAGSAGGTTATAVVVNPAGTQVIVTGTDSNAADDGAYATVAYGAAGGAVQWTRRDTSRGYLPPPAAALGPGGGTVYLTYAANNAQYAIEAVSAATGVRQWQRTDGHLAQAIPDSVAASPSGPGVYVTGSSDFGTELQYATVAYQG
jgi:hypothetical protein